ncbi:MAG: glycosyltransferase family 2 protein [Firmicutes bacterium]|nr:glycosyltransferase family 2 protein [Bacillota bacterium]
MTIVSNDAFISVIIITYNSENYIYDCIMSIQDQTYLNYEVIVLDNASTDSTMEVIVTNFPWVKIINSNENLGFAGGVNLAYECSKGEYIALLNPDAKADNDWLRNLSHTMDKERTCGICASLILQWGTEIIDTAGDGCTRAGKGFKIGNNELAKRYSETKEVFAACGGAALYRRSMIEEIGFFDEDFFLLHEDSDLSFRARLAGWKCIYVPNAVVEHKVSASIGYKTSIAVYHAVKNTDMVWLKNLPITLMLITLPEKALSDLALFIYVGIVHGKIKEYFKAKWYILSNLLKILEKRRYIQGKRKITQRNILNKLTPFISMQYLILHWRGKRKELNIRFKGSFAGESKRINNNSDS